MEAKTHRYISDGKGYDAFLPKAKLTDTTMKRGATLPDTMRFIPTAVKQCRWQTEKLAQLLKGKSVYDTCRNIWEFLYHHVRFHKDDTDREQIRSPARSWHDRERGIDCDCFTVFISTMLANLGIPHTLRITKYRGPGFQHIYPIVPTKDGKYITLDCVTDRFNYEEPYTEKEDTPMDLQFLEGFEDELQQNSSGELGKKGWFKRFTHNALHAFNRFNPATVLLRNGILASLKLNLFKVAQKLKYAYLSQSAAQQKGMDMGRWQQLVKVKDKLENIFFGAGGKQENFKKAILTGKGNSNHDVSGLGYVPDANIHSMDENTPLDKLLGKEIYESENKVDGLGELGVIAAAAVASASAIMAAIAEIIKKIGNPFAKKDDKGSEDFNTTGQDNTDVADATKNLTEEQKKMLSNSPDNSGNTQGDNSNGNGDKPEGFWSKNKKWLKPTLFGAAGLGAALGGYGLWRSKKKHGKKDKENLSGVKSHKEKPAKKNIALM